jgi:hypothetical protein
MSAADGYGLYSTILPAWASALLVFQSWAMRRPLYVGRATVRVPRFFYMPYGNVELLSVLGIQAEGETLVADDENITQT